MKPNSYDKYCDTIRTEKTLIAEAKGEAMEEAEGIAEGKVEGKALGRAERKYRVPGL